MGDRAPRPRFVGDTLRLNKLNVLVPDGVVPSANAPEEVSLEELFECCADGEGSPNLHNVLVTSYGCDYSFVDSLVRGSPADLSGRVTIFDNQQDHARKMGGFDDSTYPGRTVVMPHFHSYDSTQAERMRMRRGTMHPKLSILEFRASESAPCDRFLRLIVSSANLGRYDSKVNNQYWVHDFVPRVRSASPRAREPDGGSGACPICQEWIGATECFECAVAIRCACTRHHDWGEAFCTDCSVRTALHHDLCRFLIHLFGPTREERPGMYLSWRALLSAFDLTPPAGVHLIMSVPGRHREGEHTGWGQWALAHKLQQGVAESASHPKVAAIEFALSSCGRVEDFRQELWRTFRTGAESSAPVRIVWPTVSMASVAMHLRRRAAASSAASRAAAVGSAGDGAEEEEEEEEGLGLTINGRTSIMYGPSDQVCRELRGDLAEHLPAFAHRRGALHHIKMAAGLAPDEAAAGGGAGIGSPLCSWVYLGSHNLSGAAWGKLEEVQRKDVAAAAQDAAVIPADGAEPRREYVILSYELGVLIIPATPRRFPLPWVSPARSYGAIGSEGVLPFSTARYLSLLHGRGSQSSHLPTLANAGTARITIAQVARDEVVDAEGRVRKLWKNARSGAPAGSELPAVLTVPHGDVRRLVRLRISGGGAQSFARMPRPSAARARMRHLRAIELVTHRKCQGGSNLGRVLCDGSEHVALQVSDLTVGQGDFRQRGDPLLRVYRLASGPKTYVMSRDGAGAEVVRAFDSELGSPCVLIAFLNLESCGTVGSAKMLRALASVRSQVDELFWGVVAYDVSDLPAEPLAPCEPFVVRHSILVAHECGLHCEADLPALVAIGTRSGRRLLRISGESALAAALAVEGGLGARLTELHERARRAEWSQAPMRLFPSRMADIAARQHGLALQASSWVRDRGIRLLMVEPEGVLKTPLAAKLLADATEAACQRRKGQLCMSKNDSFLSESVAFFRALLLAPSDGSALPALAHGSAGAEADAMADASVEEWVDTYDAFNCEGIGPSPGRLRPDGPRLVLLSNVGELETQPRPGQAEPSFGPGQAARLLDTIIARLASELGVHPAELSVRSYIAPQGRETHADADLHDEWDKPGGGMLRQAMRDAGVAPADALMVGFDYTDAQAAFAARVGHIDSKALFGGEDLDENFLSPGQARGNSAAPRAFAEACEERNRRAARKVEEDERVSASSKRQR